MTTVSKEAAREAAYSTPLEDFNVASPELFETDAHWPYFERLRAEAPVHYTARSEYGPYWSVSRYQDIIAVDSNHEVFSSSSELGGISVFDAPDTTERASFIALDPPRHDAQRKVVMPMFATESLKALEPLIRERAAKILNELPQGETFDFVERVSVELTSQMLATLFDFPFEERHLLPRCSDLILMQPGTPEEQAARFMELTSTLGRFTELWNQRAAAATPGHDLISMLAHDEATKAGDDPYRYIGNIILLIVAGSDTTRHSITGGLIALNENPDEYAKLRANPALLESMVPEVIRYQSPVAHMRRTTTRDTEIAGQPIKKGEKVLMWYVSGNRDETAIEDANRFIIDRARPRQHVSFGFGMHRCVGQRLAEMQLRVVWEEMLARYPIIEVVGEPQRLKSSFVKGYEALPVRIPN